MSIAQAVKMALKNIYTNKLRSLLTMLGIIIGVAAVIALVSIGNGATTKVTDQVKSLGSNLINVNIQGRGVQRSISYDQAMSYKNIKEVKYVSPILSANTNVSSENITKKVSIDGINDEYQKIREYDVDYGRFILPIDVDYRQKVAVLGSNIVYELFGSSNPIGNYIKINGSSYKVVGVLAEKEASMMENINDKIIIPISSAQRQFKSAGVNAIYIQATSEHTVEAAKEKIEKKLLKYFKNDDDSFRLFNQQDMLKTMGTITTTLTMALGGIAGISLVVGGIGIMNIMLVSVTERTREIGIRKAIGAKKRDILIQFLIESVVLSTIGGIIGVGVGLLMAKGASSVLDLQFVVSLNTILLSVGFSWFVGVIFGLYPANKAAKMNPIDALRYE
ncbi:MAG: ABC-type antimicrobial peptide transport system, permease component [Bacillales bacterium]|jgi:putative ABC transport system permease protein|nr:ABC-type antimicrobial peptide transport system, permease component [Bacillales bacterium]